MSHIHVNALHKSFARKSVLSGVSFSVEQGRSLVILGGSGSGKSVILKCLLGLLPIDQGSIEIDGVSLTHRMKSSERRGILQKIGMLFQNAALFDSLTVWENIAFGLLHGQKMRHDRAKELAIEKMAQVGLSPDVAVLYPNEISGGMQKRVGLARAIAADPKIIFFDEPTTGLDPIMSHIIGDLILDCSKRLGATAISITHDMACARKIADDIAMLYQGKIIWQGAAQNLETSGNPFVEQFISGKTQGPIELAVLKSE